MKPLILAIVVCAGSLAGASASAASDYPLSGTPGKLVESVDCDGGGAPTKAPIASAPAGTASPVRDAASTDPLRSGSLGTDSSAPAAVTPRRPTYRWQSLVPGAIK